MSWEIVITKKAAKQVQTLPQKVKEILFLLIRDLGMNGPVASKGWKNYSKLKGVLGDKHHCHLSKGRPTYVCCWEVKNKQLKILEVYYVGTHEKAPY